MNPVVLLLLLLPAVTPHCLDPSNPTPTCDIFIQPRKLKNNSKSTTADPEPIEARALLQNLIEHAATSQKSILDFLSFRENLIQQNSTIGIGKKFEFKSFWISNEIFVENADEALIQELKNHPDVGTLRAAATAQLSDSPALGSSKQMRPWHIDNIHAPAFWEKHGKTGENIVIGHIDTGVASSHPALSDNFIGSHGWYDPVGKSRTPKDYSPDSHGTHSVGLSVGKEVGVAPGASWMSCVGCNASVCREVDLLSCGQFMMCPTDVDGKDEDCRRRPHVITCSWGVSNTNPFYSDFYSAVISNWRRVGIIPIFSAGSGGPSCSSITIPGNSPQVLTVGASSDLDHVASFSSAGPTRVSGTKPDLVAPGVYVTSTLSDGGFGPMSGSGCSAPQVAGAVALLLSKNPSMSFDHVRKALLEAARRVWDKDMKRCGEDWEKEDWPNNVQGYGRLELDGISVTGDAATQNGLPLSIIFLFTRLVMLLEI